MASKKRLQPIVDSNLDSKIEVVKAAYRAVEDAVNAVDNLDIHEFQALEALARHLANNNDSRITYIVAYLIRQAKQL